MARRSAFVEAEPDIARVALDRSLADHLREMIVRGEWEPGARLHLPDLAASFGVSTTPLREALKVLAEEEIVEWTPGRGARVAPIRPEETAALFDVIAALEALAAEQTVVRATTEQRAILTLLHARMRAHFEAGERVPYFALNSEIHENILSFSGNDVLRATHARLQTRARRGRYLAIVDDARWRQAMSEHENLMTALDQKNAQRAGEIWRLHLLNTGLAVARAQVANRTSI